MIEISLKFEKPFDGAVERCNLNFVELSEKTLKDIYCNDLVHDCVRNLLQNILSKKPLTNMNIECENETNTSDKTPFITTIINATVHQNDNNIDDNDGNVRNNNGLMDEKEGGEAMDELKVMQRNSSKRSSMKSCKSMETVLEKSLSRQKDKSPDETKAKSVGNINDDDEDEKEDYENGESIELIFISDEFVNRVQKQEQEVIILDDKECKRRSSLTNKKKIVIITDQYKEKVLRNNSIVLTSEKKMLKKSRKVGSKTYNTNSNSFLPYDEEEKYENFEIKNLEKQNNNKNNNNTNTDDNTTADKSPN